MHALALTAQLSLLAVELSWAAPEGCPTEAEVLARLPAELDGTAAATVLATASGFSLELRVAGATRVLETPTCDEAADAAVFQVRLGLRSPVPNVPAPPPAPAPPGASAGAHWSFGLSGLAGASLWALPQALGRFGGALRVQRGPWAATLELSTSLALRFEGGPVAGAAITLRQPLDAQLGACRLFALGPVELGPCLHFAASWLEATGLNVSGPRRTSVALWAVGPGVRAYLHLTPWLELLASAVGRFGARPQVFFEGNPAVVEGGLFGLELQAGAGARF